MEFREAAASTRERAADATFVAADSDEGGEVFDPASTTPHSLMRELPPRPPSPYKTMQHNAHRTSPGKSSVAATFLRGRRNPHAISGSSAALVVHPNSDSFGKALHCEPASSANDVRAGTGATSPSAGSAPSDQDSGHDTAMQEQLLREAQRRQLTEMEENTRNALIANEEVTFTNLLIDALQCRAELLAGNDAEVLVVADMVQRAEARREMLSIIEVEVAARLREERLGELLEVQFRALLPAHAAGCQRIGAEERDDLHRVFCWHKEHRPLGPGCFIKGPEEDYRLKHASRGTSAATATASSRSLAIVNAPGQRSGLSSAPSSRDYAEQLRQRGPASATPDGALGELALFPSPTSPDKGTLIQDGTFGPGEEAVYAQEGRLRLQAQKTRRYEELRRFTDIAEAQADARQYVLAEEAMLWMQLTGVAVDDLYAAAEAMRVRAAQDASEVDARAEREAQRRSLKVQLLRERGLAETTATAAEDTDRLVEEMSGATKGSFLPEAMHFARRASVDGADSRVRRTSQSTVVDASAATDASLKRVENSFNDDEAESESKTANNNPNNNNNSSDAPLTHLRLIAEEMGDPAMCRQLTTMMSSENAGDMHDEL